MAIPHTVFSTLLVLLLLLPISHHVDVFAQTVGSTSGLIHVGSSLDAMDNSSIWLSHSGDFAFGFRQLTNSTDFILSIWYDKIPDRTIVWHANGEKLAPLGSKVELTSDRGLLLTDPQGQVLWKSPTMTVVVSHGVMKNTGNFVLEDGSFNKVWESFNNPTDTILPTQTMERGGVISSRKSKTNFSKGRFRLRFLRVGNEAGKLVLNTVKLPSTQANGAYYIKDDTVGDSNTSSLGRLLVFNESGYLYILKENGENTTLTEGRLPTAKNFYFRATLNFDGVFTQYYHPMTSIGNASWIPVWSIPDNICIATLRTSTGAGVCGYNSVCNLNLQARCEEDELRSKKDDLYNMEELRNTFWSSPAYTRLSPFTESNCKNSCLQDCMCAVAMSVGDYTCRKMMLPLVRGTSDTINGIKTLIKVRKDNLTISTDPYFPIPGNETVGKNQDSLILSVSVLLGCSLLVNFTLVGAIFLAFYRKKVDKTKRNGSVLEMNLRCFTYQELVDATNGFKEELGRGSFVLFTKEQ